MVDGGYSIWRFRAPVIEDQGMVGIHQLFMPIVMTRVKPLHLFGVLVSSYFVDLILNHGHHVINGESMINISCYY